MGSARGVWAPVSRAFGSAVVLFALASSATAVAQIRTTPLVPTTPPEREQAPPREPERNAARPELFPRVPMARAAGWMLPPEPAPSGPEDRGEESLDRYFDDALGEDRIASGRADGWYGEAQRALRQNFRPNIREVIGERRAGMSPIERAFDELRRYAGGPERPQDPPNIPPPDVLDAQHDPLDQAGLRWAEQVNLLNGTANWYRVDVRVVHNPEGVVHGSWVIRSSGYDSLDRAALRAVRDGSLELPPPPRRIVRERQSIASDWAFEAADVATYFGQMGCVDDPVGGGVTCTPGDGRGLMRTRVRLLRVVDATHPTFEERRRDVRERPPRLDGSRE